MGLKPIRQTRRGVLDEPLGVPHRISERHPIRRAHLDRLDTLRQQGRVSRRRAADDHRDPYARGGRGARHGLRQLSVRALRVGAALTGDDEVGTAHARGELRCIEHELGPRAQSRIEEREQSRSQATGRARTRNVADIATDEGLDHVGVPRERGIELGDHLRRRALLGPVDRGRALGSEQRIAHVTGDLDRRPDQPWIGLPFEMMQARERRAALGEVLAVAIEEPIAERAGHPRAAVVRRAAADADHEPVRPARRCREDEVAGATRRRHAWIALVIAQQWQPARGGHLHDRGRAIAKDPPLRIDLAQQRIVDARRADPPVRCADESVDGALAAVGERQLVELRVRQDAAEAARDRSRDGDRVGTSFE